LRVLRATFTIDHLLQGFPYPSLDSIIDGKDLQNLLKLYIYDYSFITVIGYKLELAKRRDA
jgi:hypothetical protein